ncbi:Transposase [Corynebacterium kutscheri]|uniref:Transposase n=1 Tax=Corynebacterium kutscheri TaxID=35755 RepID=A0A0F6TDH8_9CORY|nr:Transposase [Corynebacterium kutscheri]VEH09945.1 transposase [Corynebacterium kutscheri]
MTYDYVIGMDVGTYFHYACVLDSSGHQVLSKRINQHEQSLRKILAEYAATTGVVMRQLSRIHAGNLKTDVRDAYIIAYAGKNLPESLRKVDRVEEAFLQLKVLNGIDEDLVRSYTRLINQIRSALVGTYLAFEHVLRGQMIHRK